MYKKAHIVKEATMKVCKLILTTEGCKPSKEHFINVPGCEANVTTLLNKNLVCKAAPVEHRLKKTTTEVHFKNVPEYEAMMMTLQDEIKEHLKNLPVREAMFTTPWDNIKARCLKFVGFVLMPTPELFVEGG